MDFIKKHYEKVLLGIVLFGLVVSAAFLPLMIGKERADMDARVNEILNRPAKPLPPPSQELARAEVLIKRAETPYSLDLSSPNKLFNPDPWQQALDKHLVRLPPGGTASLCQYTNRTPLFTTFGWERVETNEPVRYVISVARDAAATSAQRARKQYSAKLGEKKEKEGFTIVEVKGPPENPQELVLELSDTDERISVTRDKPYKRVDGYLADIKYDPQKLTWTKRRLGDPIVFGGEVYNIVAINKDEVVLSAKSNGKKTPIPYSGP